MSRSSLLDLEAVAGTTSGTFISFIQRFDDVTGSSGWTSIQVAVVTAIVLGTIRYTCRQEYGVNWYSLLHATVTGIGSFVCVWLNVFAAEALTGGTSEPLGSILCQGPLTSLHAILPAITMGFGVFDIIEGFSHGMDFILHGFATFSIMAYFCVVGVPEIINPMLLMEISTINLCLMRASFISERLITVNMISFMLSFFVYRMVICPYLWWEIFTTVWYNRNNPTSQACLPFHFPYVVFTFGMFFNCLNSFWFYKIIKKFIRKFVTGKEKISDKNDLKDRND